MHTLLVTRTHLRMSFRLMRCMQAYSYLNSQPRGADPRSSVMFSPEFLLSSCTMGRINAPS